MAANQHHRGPVGVLGGTDRRVQSVRRGGMKSDGGTARRSHSNFGWFVLSSDGGDLRRRPAGPRRVRAAGGERRTDRRHRPAAAGRRGIESGPISALKWGDEPPQVVFLHGGGQNAHTWDTVILGLGVPALAVDLPGHGRSAWREDGDYGPKLNAETLRAGAARVGARRRAWSSACRSAG